MPLLTLVLGDGTLVLTGAHVAIVGRQVKLVDTHLINVVEMNAVVSFLGTHQSTAGQIWFRLGKAQKDNHLALLKPIEDNLQTIHCELLEK